jgi:uncharacterized membrane protein
MDVMSFMFGFVSAVSVVFLVMFAVAASMYKKRNGG